MIEPRILVLDEGTTSTRAMLYGIDGELLGMAQAPLQQFYAGPGRVEHDAGEILHKTLACAREMVLKAGGARHVAALGITNQRETVVAWDRVTGQPIHNAIVWQDRRTADFCERLRQDGHEPMVQARTGLLLDPYFSATKMRWLLDAVPHARSLGPRLALGTIESWLVWNLTGGTTGGAHVSDVTNASRTSLMDLHSLHWDEALCELFGVPMAALPTIVPCAGPIATTAPDIFGAAIPITGMAGDQQAATIGQGCLRPGETKATFGTGAFVLTNMGNRPPRSDNRLLSTVLYEVGSERCYALEGAIFAAGSAIEWLRDTFALAGSAAQSEALARSVPDSGGVVFVPALSGLGAPHWQPDARASLTGLTFSTSRAQIVRAALEAMAHQCHDLKTAFEADGAGWKLLRIDGGMSGNDWLAQDLADILEVPCERPADTETTARGAALLAAVGADIYPSLDAATTMLAPVTRFEGGLSEAERLSRLAAWQRALSAVYYTRS